MSIGASASVPRCAHLESIDLSRNCLADEDLALAEELCDDVNVDDQEEDRAGEDFRYSAVGE
ncbi:MAG: hypothetical protein IT380_06360 [Myxococcales bacterium]|nr:hypothetical protein [Myxococcales bacterium]